MVCFPEDRWLYFCQASSSTSNRYGVSILVISKKRPHRLIPEAVISYIVEVKNSSGSQITAIDRIIATRDKRSLCRAQEQNKFRNFLRVTNSSDRMFGSNPVHGIVIKIF